MKKVVYGERFYNTYADVSMLSARVVTDALLRYIPKPSTVIDIGCGIGTWLKVWQEKDVEIQGVDGDYVNRSQLLIDSGKFIPMNLNSTVPINKIFDLAESLEVAEHLPDDCADAFVSFLCSLSSMVLFSAAIPHQSGDNHINEQWPEYWADKFQSNGYDCVDIIRNAVWHDKRCAYYYAQNTFLYVRHDVLDRYPDLKNAAENTDIKTISRVHPIKWLQAINRIERLQSAARKLPWNILVRLVTTMLVKIKRIVWPNN